MAGVWRLGDCLLLAILGYVLATIWRALTDWRQPEPEDQGNHQHEAWGEGPGEAEADSDHQADREPAEEARAGTTESQFDAERP